MNFDDKTANLIFKLGAFDIEVSRNLIVRCGNTFAL
jgi:hypothetical protein